MKANLELLLTANFFVLFVAQVFMILLCIIISNYNMYQITYFYEFCELGDTLIFFSNASLVDCVEPHLTFSTKQKCIPCGTSLTFSTKQKYIPCGASLTFSTKQKLYFK